MEKVDLRVIMSETGFVMGNRAGKDVNYDKGKKSEWN